MFPVLELKPVASQVLGKCFTTEPCLFFILFNFKIESHLIVPDGLGLTEAQVGLEIATSLPLSIASNWTKPSQLIDLGS